MTSACWLYRALIIGPRFDVILWGTFPPTEIAPSLVHFSSHVLWFAMSLHAMRLARFLVCHEFTSHEFYVILWETFPLTEINPEEATQPRTFQLAVFCLS